MKKMPVLFTFDVDGETLWLNRDPENIDRPVTLSLGQYGPREGLPRILKLLEKLEEHDDVQNVYANFDISDEILQNLEG